MSKLRQAWHLYFGEPFLWIFLAFFQPQRFARDFESLYPRRLQRFGLIFRLIFPMIVLGYPVALAGQCILIPFHLVSPDIFNILLSAALCIALCIAGGIALGIAVGIAFGIAFGIAVGIAFGIAVGIAFGIAVGIAGGIAFGIALGIALGIAVGIAEGIAFGIALGIAFGIAEGIAFEIGFFRLPFYLVSGPSMFKVSVISRKQPSRALESLKRSSLHWDELVYLPLPNLKQTLLLAYEATPVETLEEMTFIVTERPLQIQAVRVALIEIALHDLAKRHSLDQIALAAAKLAELLPPTSKLVLRQRWSEAFARLSEASRDAARAISPIGLQGRRKALEDLQANLRKVYPHVAFRSQRLNLRLEGIVENWSKLARLEQERLLHAAQDVGQLDNPYKPGQFLPLKDALFVGRRELAQELESALSLKGRLPTFLLNGERRMGKTSILQQLPYLLGSPYISVFYNLQQPGLYASTATFLGALAQGIQQVMNARAMDVGRAADDLFRGEYRYTNEARVYHTFERWLENVERLLEREDRTLLLAFDEFEMLAEIEQSGPIKILPLLNWMRNIIQFHPRIALLFSGVKTFHEMGGQQGIDWNGYFINVQTLRVSFLQPDEARHLIIHPTEDYPGETIFSAEVVERMLSETGCHPFLLQALSSSLITLLNVEHREQAQPADVMRAGEKVLREWEGHFIHLWNRSDEAQRACMQALLVQPPLDIAGLAAQTSLETKVVRQTMQRLLRRDLVSKSPDERYGLAVPIFRQWLEQNQ
jgi:uncharacterized protein